MRAIQSAGNPITIVLTQEDVVASREPNLPATVTLGLTPHGLARLDEMRTKYGIGVLVKVEFDSSEFYQTTTEAPPA